ncbi:hypothetical protein [Flavobacterium sp. S87F.05.LMB.W.Kidney.N]|uniref:hypothetical protein n=1 Tax=Flavobacterium sp. S87F.05.LMB.W.Kidney.N TaxID=1278758 RepID=UPI001066124D|nr:hypothetical protein [Flavobacterium sp. S87F.05.LMB.W.Kidney.N]TDX11200.1 hypothetical protein EDB96_1978 [Flavobacterium sp. S87F.05.LMB.W.Kidney.N]
MKKKLLSLIFLVSIIVSAQNKSKKNSLSEPKILNTKKENIANLSKRINSYPFNKSSQIKIISCNLSLNNENLVASIITDTVNKKREVNITNLEYITPFELPRKNLDSLSLENVAQIKTLTIPQIEKLSDILYNTCSKLNISCSEITRGCYLPRNAILFFDENNKVFEYIEICFECKTKETFGKIENLDLSDNMYKQLEFFFNVIGIKTKYTLIVK